MARKAPDSASGTLRDIEETGDRAAEWASENAAYILGAIAVALVLAIGIGLWLQHRTGAQDAAADALARVSAEYRQAMGAPTGAVQIPEPANPELAARTRETYAQRYEAVALEHQGSAASAIAWLEAGKLQVELGLDDAAATSFAAGRDEAGASAIGALAWTRIAGLAEARGDFPAAAQAYESAAAIEEYPGRPAALGDAARCWATAGDADAALAAFQRLEIEFPDELVDPAIGSLVAELQYKINP